MSKAKVNGGIKFVSRNFELESNSNERMKQAVIVYMMGNRISYPSVYILFCSKRVTVSYSYVKASPNPKVFLSP